MGKTRKKKVREQLACRFIFVFALSKFSGPDYLGARNRLCFDLTTSFPGFSPGNEVVDLIDQHQNKRFYVMEIVVPLGFADVTFRVEHTERSGYQQYVCVRTL